MSKTGKISYLIFTISFIVLLVARLLLGGWINVLFVPLGLVILSFITALVVDYKFYLEFLSMRTTKHGMNMGALIVFALALLISLNYLSVRFDKTFDLSKEKLNSLADQSKSVLQSLKSELRFIILYKNKELRDRAQEVREMLRLYEKENAFVKIQLVDMSRDVETAKKYLSRSEPIHTAVEYQGRKVSIEASGPEGGLGYQEKEITAALLKIVRDQPMTVYMLTGHGERDTETSSIESVKSFVQLLKAEAYNVQTLNLLLGDKLPDTDSVLAIIGPKSPFSDKELEQIREFAKSGGKLFVAADPGEKHQISLIMRTFGVEFKNNYILNETNLNEGLVGAVGIQFDEVSPITQKLVSSRSIVVFPFASEVSRAADAPAEYTYRDLVKSHERSYVSMNANAVKNPDRASRTMGLSVKSDKFSGVFYGDSDFLSDVRLAQWMHADLALNSVAFLFNDNVNLTIRPKSLEATAFNITSTQWVILAIAAVSLPLVFIILGGIFVYRRRYL